MVKKLKRRMLVDVFIKTWFYTNNANKLKVVCKKEFKMDDSDFPDFIKGYAYIMNKQHGDDGSTELWVKNSNKYKHLIYTFGKKNKFFHKHFDIARIK